jgi:hypothetical protein
LYGYEPNLEVVEVYPDDGATDKSVLEFIEDRAAHAVMLKEQLSVAQNRMKLQADKQRTNKVFQVGEQVLLKLQPYAQQTVVNRPYPKLAFKFFGPYTVLKRVGSSAYRLDLPPDSKVHNVFHVSQLKPFTPDHTPNYAKITKLVDLVLIQLNPKPSLIVAW